MEWFIKYWNIQGNKHINQLETKGQIYVTLIKLQIKCNIYILRTNFKPLSKVIRFIYIISCIWTRVVAPLITWSREEKVTVLLNTNKCFKIGLVDVSILVASRLQNLQNILSAMMRIQNLYFFYQI